MKACWLVVIMGLACSAVSAQPGDRNSIDVMVRIAGNETWVDNVDAWPGQTVEVGVFYFRDRGYMFAGANHHIIAGNWGVAGGDVAMIVDNPNSPIHPDGRVSPLAYGGQVQAIYTTGIDTGRMRISSFGNPDYIPIGGVAPFQAPPPAEPLDDTTDGLLGYRFNITIGTLNSSQRHIPIEVPVETINAFSVYLTLNSPQSTSLLADLDGTNGAQIRVVPSVGAASTVLAAVLLMHRRRSR